MAPVVQLHASDEGHDREPDGISSELVLGASWSGICSVDGSSKSREGPQCTDVWCLCTLCGKDIEE